ncbi:hypothetical protein KFL_003050010 [Klebsormidium nitens]|uniref:Uncharacterized protein n=1 Tax=Klebsormidium nitens TaxID=105231 RepID=A0A1Y1IB92_KLENI|nr:hypothetical protein KFL_003050010 [Klebsormidium nitens]|eukprot:GAQ86689.1 hypothetical protein KFL_003050010 [Klebsormidium nitens]
MTNDAGSLSLLESRQIRQAMNAFKAYTLGRAEADASANGEFWTLMFSGRSAPFLPWMEDEPSLKPAVPAREGDSGAEQEAAADVVIAETHEQKGASPAEAGAQSQEVTMVTSEMEETRERLRAAEGAVSSTDDELLTGQQERSALPLGTPERVTSLGEDVGSRATEQPEGEEVGQEGPQAEGEEAEVLPVGRQKTEHLRRLMEELENIAVELQIAPADTSFPQNLVDQCNEAAELAVTCCELLDAKDLMGKDADISLTESQQIRNTIDSYSRYTMGRAEADQAILGGEFGSRSPPFLPWIGDEHRRLPRKAFHIPEEEGGGDPEAHPCYERLMLLIILKWSKRKMVQTFMTCSKLENTPKITSRRPAGYYQVVTAQHGLVGAIQDIYALRVTTNMDICQSRLQHQVRFSSDSVAKAPGYPAGDFYQCDTVEEKLAFVKHDTAFLHLQESRVGSKSGYKTMPALELSETGKLQVGDAVRNVGAVAARNNGVVTGAVIIYRDDGRFVGKVQTEDPAASADDAPVNKKHGYCEDGESGGNWGDTEEDERGTYPALAYTNNSVSTFNYVYAPEYTLESFEKYVMGAI